MKAFSSKVSEIVGTASTWEDRANISIDIHRCRSGGWVIPDSVGLGASYLVAIVATSIATDRDRTATIWIDLN